MSTEPALLTEGAYVIATTGVKRPDGVYVRPGEALPSDLPGIDELLKYGSAKVSDTPGTEPSGEPLRWRADIRLEKYEGDNSEARAADPNVLPDDVIETTENLLTIGGASALWHRVSGGTSVTVFDNTNAYLGVGDSTTAAANTQTDLQATTNKLRKAMDASYPQHTDSASNSAAMSITFRSTFGTSDANFAWQEWAVFNASTAGRMLNRKVESLGTKVNTATWTLTLTLSLA